MTDWTPTGDDPATGSTLTTHVGPWRVTVRFPPDSPAGRGPTELHITLDGTADPQQARRGITTGTLRDIPLKAATEKITHAREVVTHNRTNFYSGHEQDTSRAVQLIRQEVTDRPQPGRAGRPEAFYASIAVAYAHRAAVAPDPIRWLAQQAGADERTAENWVRQARARGMLTPPRPGVAGGQPTDTATRLLNQPPDQEGK